MESRAGLKCCCCNHDHLHALVTVLALDQQHRLSLPCPACRYDAVTTSGHLQWQDTVNDLNQPFFDAADGIFVNYTWKADTPSQAAAAAGPRRRDVFMGIVSLCAFCCLYSCLVGAS